MLYSIKVILTKRKRKWRKRRKRKRLHLKYFSSYNEGNGRRSKTHEWSQPITLLWRSLRAGPTLIGCLASCRVRKCRGCRVVEPESSPPTKSGFCSRPYSESQIINTSDHAVNIPAGGHLGQAPTPVGCWALDSVHTCCGRPSLRAGADLWRIKLDPARYQTASPGLRTH